MLPHRSVGAPHARRGIAALAASRHMAGGGGWFVLVATAVAAALRFSTLDVQSYWSDEGSTVFVIDRGFGSMMHAVAWNESTPPLYYMLAWAWVHTLGTGEIALRSLSALVGTALVPVAYQAGATLVSRRAAQIAAVLVAANPLLVWYSQEARAYALFALFAGLSLLFFGRALSHVGSRPVTYWGITSALALCTHYFAIFLIVPEAAILLHRRELRGVTARVTCVLALVAAALLPLARHQAALHHGATGYAFLSMGVATRVAQIPKQFLVGFDSPAETAVAVASLALAACGCALLARRSAAPARRASLWLALVFVGAAGIPVALALVGVDYLKTQNVIAALVPSVLVVAAGCASAKVGPAIAASLCAIGLFVVVSVDVNPEYQREDWRGAARALGSPRVARVIVLESTEPPIIVYQRGLVVLRPHGRQVREVDFVGIGEKAGHSGWRTPTLHVPSLPVAFRFVSRSRTDKFVILRYESDRPVVLRPTVFSTDGLAARAHGAPGVYYQPAAQT